MPMAKNPMDDKYVQQFKKHLDEVDAFTLVVLKSHLIMESAIDNVLRLIFFHPDIILDARMNFFQKVEIVRAGLCAARGRNVDLEDHARDRRAEERSRTQPRTKKA